MRLIIIVSLKTFACQKRAFLYISLAFLWLLLPQLVSAQIIAQDPPFVLSIDQFKSWTSEGPLADKRNIATEPLAQRFELTGSQMNPARSNHMEIVIVPDGMNGLGNYMVEQSKFNLYNFTHWSYIDKIIWFGGPVVVPSAPWVNAAHKNGVKVLGNVFLAPNAFGGTNEIVSNFLEKDSEGNFIAAQKLVEISTYYQFDGWFINMETNTTAANGALMLEFVTELKRLLPDDQEVVWYDAMLPLGRVWWQNELNTRNSMFLQNGDTRVSDEMFVNFFWPRRGNPNTSKITAQAIGRSEFDIFTGVDLWPGRDQAPFEVGGNDWMRALHVNDTPITSLGLFVPNAIFDHANYSQFRSDPNDVATFYGFERHMFSGADENPAIEDTTAFKGIGHWVPAASTITQLPFETNFNTGHGKLYATQGSAEMREWHDMGKQDILPTWQFALEGTESLQASFDFAKAYQGGSSLRVNGSLAAGGNTILKLYKTKLAVSSDTQIDLTYQTGSVGATHMQVIYAFSDAPDTFISQPVGSATSRAWNVKSIDLSAESGRELAVIGLSFQSEVEVNGYEIHIGGLKVHNGSAGDQAQPIAGFETANTTVKTGAPVRFISNATNATSWAWQFEGGTPATSTAEHPTVVFDAIGKYKVSLRVTNEQGSATETKMDFVSVNNDPITRFDVSGTQILKGASLKYTSNSTNATAYQWQFPGGAPATSTEVSPIVAYHSVGAFDVSLTATNADGQHTATKTKLINVSLLADIKLTELSNIDTITARAEIHTNEGKEKAFDELPETKWLDNGGVPSLAKPSWLQVKFKKPVQANTLVLVSANDAPDRSPENFSIQGSHDGANFTVLERWKGVQFTNTGTKLQFNFFNQGAYAFYRLEITKNAGEVSLTQIAEIELRGEGD